MGESQCPTCGHVITGFEDQDFRLMREAEVAKDAEIERLRAALSGLVNALAANDEDGLTEFAEPMCAARAALQPL